MAKHSQSRRRIWCLDGLHWPKLGCNGPCRCALLYCLCLVPLLFCWWFKNNDFIIIFVVVISNWQTWPRTLSNLLLDRKFFHLFTHNCSACIFSSLICTSLGIAWHLSTRCLAYLEDWIAFEIFWNLHALQVWICLPSAIFLMSKNCITGLFCNQLSCAHEMLCFSLTLYCLLHSKEYMLMLFQIPRLPHWPIKLQCSQCHLIQMSLDIPMDVKLHQLLLCCNHIHKDIGQYHHPW